MDNYEMIQKGVIVLVLSVVIIGMMIFVVRRILKMRILVPNNMAAIIYGRRSKVIDPNTGKTTITQGKVVKGAGVFKIPYLEEAIYASLTSISIVLDAKNLPDKNFIGVDVRSVAIVRVIDTEHGIRTAIKNFGDFRGKQDHIKEIMYEILLGRLKDTVSTLTLEQIATNREKVHQEVLEASSEILAQMGMELVSFNIQEVHDQMGVLEMKKKQAFKNEEIRTSNAEKERDVVFEKNKKIVFNERNQREQFEETKKGALNVIKIEAEKRQELAEVDKTREITLHNTQLNKELELLQQAVNRYKEEEFYLMIKKSEAEAQSKKLQAEGDAEAIQLIGLAEAEAKNTLVSAYKNLDHNSKILFILDKLPDVFETLLNDDRMAKIMAEAAKPLSSIDSVKIYDFGGGSVDGNPIQKFAESAPAFLINLISKAKDLGLNDLLQNISMNTNILEEVDNDHKDKNDDK